MRLDDIRFVEEGASARSLTQKIEPLIAFRCEMSSGLELRTAGELRNVGTEVFFVGIAPPGVPPGPGSGPSDWSLPRQSPPMRATVLGAKRERGAGTGQVRRVRESADRA